MLGAEHEHRCRPTRRTSISGSAARVPDVKRLCPCQTLTIRSSLYYRFVRFLGEPPTNSQTHTTTSPAWTTPGTIRAAAPSKRCQQGCDSSVNAIAIQFLWPVNSLSMQEKGSECDKLYARYIDVRSKCRPTPTSSSQLWILYRRSLEQSRIKSVPLKRIHEVLMDSFGFHGAHPVVIPKSRGVEYITQNFRAHLTPSHGVLQNVDGFYLPQLGFPANFWHRNPCAKD